MEMVVDKDSLLLAHVAPCSFRPAEKQIEQTQGVSSFSTPKSPEATVECEWLTSGLSSRTSGLSQTDSTLGPGEAAHLWCSGVIKARGVNQQSPGGV